MFGNLDKGKERQFPSDWAGHLVVFQEKVKLVEGNLLALPNQSGLQTYNPEQFEQMTENNFFSDSELRVTVLHDPRLEAEAGPLEVKATKGKAKKDAEAEAGPLEVPE
jgi:hypothetical protein